jgi:hypothetical protein
MWGLHIIAGTRVCGFGYGTSIPAPARPDGYEILPNPWGYFFTIPSPFIANTRRVIGYRVPIAIPKQTPRAGVSPGGQAGPVAAQHRAGQTGRRAAVAAQRQIRLEARSRLEKSDRLEALMDR